MCAEASDGQEAITKALKLRPRIIVLDFAMPGMSGLLAARILKAAIPDAQLILFSGLANLISAEDLRQSGFAAVVSKDQPGALMSEALGLLDAA